MAHKDSGMVETVEKILAGSAALFLLAAAGMALLVVLGDPDAPARCIGAGSVEGWEATVRCLSRAGYGLPVRLTLGAAGVGLLAALLTTLRSRAEDRAVAGSVRSALASLHASEGETA
jgi:hypothetical protein